MPVQKYLQAPRDMCTGCDQKKRKFARVLEGGLKGRVEFFCVNVGNCWAAVNPEVVRNVWELVDETAAVEPADYESITEE